MSNVKTQMPNECQSIKLTFDELEMKWMHTPNLFRHAFEL